MVMMFFNHFNAMAEHFHLLTTAHLWQTKTHRLHKKSTKPILSMCKAWYFGCISFKQHISSLMVEGTYCLSICFTLTKHKSLYYCFAALFLGNFFVYLSKYLQIVVLQVILKGIFHG